MSLETRFNLETYCEIPLIEIAKSQNLYNEDKDLNLLNNLNYKLPGIYDRYKEVQFVELVKEEEWIGGKNVDIINKQ